MTLFLMPAVYAMMNKNSEKRKAKAEARRQRIADGVSRKQAKLAGKQPPVEGRGFAYEGEL